MLNLPEVIKLLEGAFQILAVIDDWTLDSVITFQFSELLKLHWRKTDQGSAILELLREFDISDSSLRQAIGNMANNIKLL